MPNTLETYNNLLSTLRRLDRFNSIGSLIGWDEQVNLPPESGSLRAEQMAVFTEISHKEMSDPKIGDLLGQLESESSQLDAEALIVIKEARKDYDRLVKIPPEFSAKKAKSASEGFQAWQVARKDDDFKSFIPHLKTQISLAKEEAGFITTGDPYDYWVDQFDPGMTTAVIEKLFTGLKPELKEIVGQIEASPVKPDTSIFKGFPVDKQKECLLKAVEAIGFDFSKGRLDVATHPFCSGHTLDTRMTTRYAVDNPLDSLSSSMHETGHALYQQGLPTDFPGTALSEHIGMAVHESQSRTWENQVGRSRKFWNWFEPTYRAAFPDQLSNISSEKLFLAVNKVAVTPIRVDADEVTYNMHIMIRFELEKLLFNGSLAVEDLPDAWKQVSQDILGYTPPNNALGCLQDVHWSGGAFGYFPSYCLGNLLAAQLWYKVIEEIPDLEEGFENGVFSPLLDWLRKNVHSIGKRMDTQAFALEVTGKELSYDSLVRYLKERYLPLYT